MKKILFRADAAPHIGIGDLMSLIHLSKYFQADGWQTCFLIKDNPAALDLVKRYTVENIDVIPASLPVKAEVTRINEICEERNIDVIFFEISERKLSEYIGLVPKPKKVAACFDGYLPDGIHMVLNWAPDAYDVFDPADRPDINFLLGMEYVILPQQFFDDPRIENRKLCSHPKKLLIVMGGADEFDFTNRVISCLIKKGVPDLTVRVIIGSGYSNRSLLEANLKNAPFTSEILHNITDMLEHYLWCDYAIGAGGLTASELVATRTASSLIATYEHQIKRCEAFANKGLAYYEGSHTFVCSELMAHFLNPISPSAKFTFKTKSILSTVNTLIDKEYA